MKIKRFNFQYFDCQRFVPHPDQASKGPAKSFFTPISKKTKDGPGQRLSRMLTESFNNSNHSVIPITCK